MHAVSNPVANGIEPTALNHRAPGYGIIKFRRSDREIEFANWPRWVDASMAGSEPYPGWPIRIHQTDSGLPSGYSLPPVESGGVADPVVQVIDESNGEVVYTLRIQGSEFTPTVREPGSYAVRLVDSATGTSAETTGQVAARK